ncbi:16S rRNA (adenine(1518)-N(6)/adenine(1519)-N(6))-dimethyltransferase RsmA [bacterium]|nr:16S rRNA (adenine(1518)-N(6)/adenine(1519)-N(6))-dimethyltransferase RsmA [bacterium]
MSHPRTILDGLGAAARKSLSQNFLVSPHWAEKLALKALAVPADAVWEIGPGLAALTTPLLKNAQVPVTLFEYDRKLSEYLRGQFPQVELVEGDVLEADLEARAAGKRLSVLSNLPYHLSSQILFRFAEFATPPVQMVFTFQREFAQRVVAEPRTSAYGALSVLMQLQFEVEKMGIIPPGAFYPAPEVDSEALCFQPRGKALGPAFRAMVRGAFQQRRKKLLGNLKKSSPGMDWEESLESLGVDPNARAEELSPEQFFKLGEQRGLFIAEPNSRV